MKDFQVLVYILSSCFYSRTSFDAKSLCVLHLSALRELFRAKSGSNFSELVAEELTRDIGLPQCEKEDIKAEVQYTEEVKKTGQVPSMEVELDTPVSGRKSLMDLNDAADEFFDVPEPTDCGLLENDWPGSELSTGQKSPVLTVH